jgi:hypothetical protein
MSNNDGSVTVTADCECRRTRKCRAAEAEEFMLRREVGGSIREYVSQPVRFISTSQGLPDQANKVWAEV